MFKFFKKGKLENLEEKWLVMKNDQGDMSFSINSCLKESAPVVNYPIRFGIAMPIEEFSKDTFEKLSDLEDSLNNKLNNGIDGVVLLRIKKFSSEMFVEFVTYTKEGLDFENIHEALKEEFPEFDVQAYAKNDPSWEVYLSYLR